MAGNTSIRCTTNLSQQKLFQLYEVNFPLCYAGIGSLALNQKGVGSIPTGGARNSRPALFGVGPFLFKEYFND